MSRPDPARVLPLELDPTFVPLPADPRLVTAAQRAAAFPGLGSACHRLAQAFIRDLVSQQPSQPTPKGPADEHPREVA